MHRVSYCAISLALFGLAGCEGDTLSDLENHSDNQTLIPATKLIYSPADGDISVPNDLLFSGSQDGTLNLPVLDASDFTDPTLAISALDGWSTQQPFLIEFELDNRVESIDPNTSSQPGIIRLFETVMGGSTDNQYPQCQTVQQGLACEVINELVFGVDFITQALSSTQVAVIPLKPLKLDSHYLLSVSRLLTDSEGRPIEMSDTYRSVRQSITDYPLATDAQRSLQALINSFENALAGFGVKQDELILTAAMTTQSASTLPLLKGLLVQNPQNLPVISQPLPVENQGLNITALEALGLSDLSCPQLAALATSGTANAEQMALIEQSLPFCISKLYSASIQLPYYSGIANSDNPGGATGADAWWQANCDSGATLAGAVAQGAELPQQPQSDNDTVCMNFGLRDLGLDLERNITQFNPVPKVRAYDDIEIQITIPDPQYLALSGSPVTQMPEAGWPVVIMQHGIGGQKEYMLSLTGALGYAGFATISIDMTLHGSRGFDINNDGEYDVQANATDVTAFMNLENALATRDNVRQSIADLLGLRLGVANLASTEFAGQKLNNDNVYFIGHSLGGIVGYPFTALANTQLNESIDSMFKIKAAAFANTAGGIASFLLSSNSFADFIKGNILLSNYRPFLNYLAENEILLADLLADAAAYQTQKTQFLALSNLALEEAELFELGEAYLFYLLQNNVNIQSIGEADHLAHYKGFVTNLAQNEQARVSGQIQQFRFAFQTAIDSADPNQYADRLKQTNTPVLLTEIWGDGTSQTWDQTIPPIVEAAPLSGTEALARISGLSVISQAVQNSEGISGLVRFNSGEHNSVFLPNSNPAVTGEMQRLIAHFFASEGTSIQFENEALIAD